MTTVKHTQTIIMYVYVRVHVRSAELLAVVLASTVISAAIK